MGELVLLIFIAGCVLIFVSGYKFSEEESSFVITLIIGIVLLLGSVASMVNMAALPVK